MSDAVQRSTMNIEALADEIVASRPKRDQWKQSVYPGLRSRRSVHAKKYRKYAYTCVSGICTRGLSDRELKEFREHIERCMDAESPKPIRLDVPR